MEKIVAGGEPIVAEETDANKLEQAKSTLFVLMCKCKSALEIWKKLQNLFEDRALNRKICLPHLLTLMPYKLACKVTLMKYPTQQVNCSVWQDTIVDYRGGLFIVTLLIHLLISLMDNNSRRDLLKRQQCVVRCTQNK